MMKKNECTIQPTSFRQWLTCGLCWEVKLGVIFLAISKLLMLWHAPLPTSLQWRAGMAVFWVAVSCLVFGLIRDVWLIATTRFQRSGKR